MQSVLHSREVTVVGYLESVKVQFDVQNLVLVHGNKASVLSCPFPREMFRFQRRNAFRVRPLMRSAPTAKLRHPDMPDTEFSLRVIDISIGGCALFLPDDVPMMNAGVVLGGVRMELDDDTKLDVNLRLQHVTSLNSESRGLRLGFEYIRPGGDTLRTLQRFIDLTQKRGKLMALTGVGDGARMSAGESSAEHGRASPGHLVGMRCGALAGVRFPKLRAVPLPMRRIRDHGAPVTWQANVLG
jgi:c-di-GMP-binding flagellar brake protein YcgR